MCLEVIFLMYYQRVVCPPLQLEEFVKLFQQQAFGAKQLHYTLLNEMGRKTLHRIGYLSMLILLECFNLEALLDNNLDDTYALFPLTYLT